ncbi:MAG TPA: EVE domain-containing protein [Dehalococcoidia bacterium]|nr:EVE domain-containing protein [Dehalococcoidia bacterium]
MASWLLKTEPQEYSFNDLVEAGTDVWDGVKNALAQQHLRQMAVGDRCLIYHSAGERQAVGWATVSRAAYPDPEDVTGRRVVVELRAGAPLARPVKLGTIRSEKVFGTSPLLRMTRLSVVPLTEEQVAAIERLAGS